MVIRNKGIYSEGEIFLVLSSKVGAGFYRERGGKGEGEGKGGRKEIISNKGINSYWWF